MAPLRRSAPQAAAALFLAWSASSATAQAPPDYDFTWSTITDPGNPAYSGPSVNGHPLGRGSVGYLYRISTLEVTTGQWLEFANMAAALGDPYRIGADPFAGYQENFGSGPRWVLRNVAHAERLPVVGISWYIAARYCNWLHNGKQNSLASLVIGAYDTTTFGPPVNGQRPDALGHLPGAKYWIPTFDEWLKAVHYSPDRYGPGMGGYWMSPNGTDTPLIRGDVRTGGQTNAGMPFLPVESVWLGAYESVQSPWGLLDASGGAAEWTESATDATRLNRRYDGTAYTLNSNSPSVDLLDLSYRSGGASPDASDFSSTGIGLRIASAIPTPSCLLVFCLGGVGLATGRRACPSGRCRNRDGPGGIGRTYVQYSQRLDDHVANPAGRA